MLFNSLDFALFFPLVFALYYALRRTEHPRRLLLLAASYFFYGSWSVHYLGLILFSTVVDYWVGRALAGSADVRRRKRLLWVSLVANLGVLGVFKYFDFFSAEFALLAGRFGFELDPFLLNVALPVGISFYTFQTLSYTIDVYRGDLEAEPDFVRFAVFVAFFPQLVAGPIVRASEFLPQLRTPSRISRDGFESGLALVFWGLTKKVLIADQLGRAFVDIQFYTPEAFSGGVMLLAVYAYCFQIYCDFSGYSDIAIGIGRMMGFRLPLNFDAPYQSRSTQEFWRRWHVSLSFWIRDYVYIPLGGNRGVLGRRLATLMITMALAGLWHGAGWTFLVFGCLNGLYLGVGVLLAKKNAAPRLPLLLGIVLTFHGWALSMIPFRAPDLDTAWRVVQSIFTPGGAAPVTAGAWLALGAAVVTHFLPRDTVASLRTRFVALAPELKAAVYAGVLGLAMNSASLERPFIYFQF